MQRAADVHLSLPEDLLASLDRVARQRGMGRAHLMREAIGEYLRRTEVEDIEREMKAYVEALAPFSEEFVNEMESETAERLLRETQW